MIDCDEEEPILLGDEELWIAPYVFPDYPNIPEGPWGSHIEKRQMDCLLRLSKGDARGITKDLINPKNKTPNQKACAAAIHLAAARLRPRDFSLEAAVAQVLEFFRWMVSGGHQSIAPERGGRAYGNEQGCPDPHSAIWARPMWTILREADLLNLSTILEMVLDYLAEHHSLCSAHWTSMGVRVAGSRAKRPAGMAMKPSWTLDSRIFAEVSGEYLKKEPCDWDTVRIARADRKYWAEIVRRARRITIKLCIQVRLWHHPNGGQCSALDHDAAMNDRLSWIETDEAGNVTGGDNTLETLPTWVQSQVPDLVFG